VASFPKPERVRDEKYLKKVREQPCLVCLELQERQDYPTEADHITSRGAGGGDDHGNVWPLCTKHHRQRHDRGLPEMVRRFRSLRIFLRIMGRQDVLDSATARED
jgi:5-methylcytosine-specific restriction endonuclease McrA